MSPLNRPRFGVFSESTSPFHLTFALTRIILRSSCSMRPPLFALNRPPARCRTNYERTSFYSPFLLAIRNPTLVATFFLCASLHFLSRFLSIPFPWFYWLLCGILPGCALLSLLLFTRSPPRIARAENGDVEFVSPLRGFCLINDTHRFQLSASSSFFLFTHFTSLPQSGGLPST